MSEVRMQKSELIFHSDFCILTSDLIVNYTSPANNHPKPASMAMDAILRLHDLTVRYGAFVAVDRLSLELRPGELFGLLGPNGAGKSSTLRVLIGQQRPAGGRVTVAGLDVVRDWERVKPLFGYVPDCENHFEEFTGRRNLRLFAGLYGVGPARVEECLELVELSVGGDL